MNIAGHIAVALHLDDCNPAMLLGAALPDLAAIGRFRLLGSTANEDVRRGIEIHHRTDEAFHRHRHFTGSMARLREVLATDGVPRGPARAVAHVGPELLIDGEMLTRDEISQAVKCAFAEASKLEDDLRGLVTPANRSSWVAHLAEVQRRGLPTDYSDPKAVAKRLYRILSGRPRLKLDESLIGAVGLRLEEEQPLLLANGVELVHEVVSLVAADLKR